MCEFSILRAVPSGRSQSRSTGVWNIFAIFSRPPGRFLTSYLSWCPARRKNSSVPKRFYDALYGGAEFTKHIHMDAYVTRRILRPKQVSGSKATGIGGYKGEMYLVLCEIWYSKTEPCKATRSDCTRIIAISGTQILTLTRN